MRLPSFKVITAPEAYAELQEIWRYNAQHKSIRQADEWVRFLERSIEKLSKEYVKGKVIEENPSLRYVLMKRRSKSDGHIAVYSVDSVNGVVNVFHVFHTKQDWQNKL